MNKVLIIIASLLTIASTSAFAQKKNDKKGEKKNYKTYLISKAEDEYSNNNINNALELAETELKSDDSNYIAHYIVSHCQMSLDNLSGALSSANKCLATIDKKDMDYHAKAYTWRGKLYAEMGDTIKALADINKSIETFPSTYAYDERIDIYMAQKKYDLCMADSKMIIDLDPSDPKGYLKLSHSYYAKNMLDEAVKNVNYAIKLNDKASDFFLVRNLYLKSQKEYVLAAKDLMNYLFTSHNQSPNFFSLLNEAAKTYMPQLEKEFKHAIYSAGKEGKTIFQYYLATSYRYVDMPEKAILLFADIIKDNETSGMLARLASCYSQIGQFDEALKCVDRAMQLQRETEPDDVDGARWYRDLKISILDDYGRGKEAIEILSNLIENGTPEASDYYRRAWIRQYEGDLTGAIEDFSQAISMDPGVQLHSLLSRGNLRRLTGDAEGAVEDFECLIDVADDDNMHNTMFAYHYLGNNDKAREILNKYIKSDPSSGSFYNAACLESLIGNKEQAIAYMDSAFSKGYIEFVHINRDRDLDNIRNEQDFKDLVAKYMDKFEARRNHKGLMLVNQNSSNNSDSTEKTVEIPFSKDGNMCKVKCFVNGLPLHFIFDTGASDVSISSVEATFMLKNEYLLRSDIRGSQNYMNANGEISIGTVINLRDVKLNDELSLSDIRASVVHNQSAPLLLGQSILERLGKIEIDNDKKVLRITYSQKNK